MDVMVDELCRMVRTMPIHIAAHSTLTPPALFDLEGDVDAWWTEEREDRYVDALAESGVALEISNRYRLPHDRLLRKALQAGVRFSLGSDGHGRDQVARLEWAAETARRVGVTDARPVRPRAAAASSSVAAGATGDNGRGTRWDATRGGGTADGQRTGRRGAAGTSAARSGRGTGRAGAARAVAAADARAAGSPRGR